MIEGQGSAFAEPARKAKELLGLLLGTKNAMILLFKARLDVFGEFVKAVRRTLIRGQGDVKKVFHER